MPPTRLAVATGNRCGHLPSAPRFDLVNLPENANHARPALIGKAIAKVRAYYASPREARWDSLSQGERQHRLARQIRAVGGSDTPAGRRLAARQARWRQQRSERREAVTNVLMLLLAYTDIATLTVAIPNAEGGGWLGLSIPWLAVHSGLSPSRVQRALATLNRANLLGRTGAGRRFDARSRRWVGAGWGPVRRLSFDFIRMLGLEVSWNREQQRQRHQARATSPPAPPPVTVSATRQTPPLTLRQRLDRRTPAQPVDPARQRRIAELAAAGLSPAEIRRRLDDAPQPP